MDKNKGKYAIQDYEIRNSTLEEVFIRLGQMEQKQEDLEDLQVEASRDNYQPEFEPKSCC